MSALTQALWVLLLGSLLGLELIGKVPPTLHTPLMSGANAISGITVLASLTLIAQANDQLPLLVLGSLSWALPCSTSLAASWSPTACWPCFRANHPAPEGPADGWT